MPSIYDLKPRFVALLRPLAARLAQGGVTANGMTLAAMADSMIVGLVLAIWPEVTWLWLLLPLFLFIRMAANAIDGILAREFGMKSRLGAILNEVGDVVSDAALYLPFALLPGVTPFWVILAVVIAVIGEMTGILGQVVGASRRYDGPMGKSDRAAIFGILGLAIGIGAPIGGWIDWIMAAICLLGLVTILNRARQALKEAAG
ncbi:CDP-diacylglycerol--glycerol-3-phosphate 3-phosphatidyltransferase [Dongia mobilis]|uniref:CDP-diacylglycerol--glycerol-3-phosphate 3-phosphatidyltransferase n=1 Tax=Dongia mobilis TaxID=578943 RepID=A0A4R6WS95_9PROT|nr:CDP-alcohol phosphatidyltransferase family protein [Dongia mobilis]TDQ84492.1 CDP-diacylglycerol--glycerol-3-phosphate 3-phosphatidyltransferase [Dongia mobilis]